MKKSLIVLVILLFIPVLLFGETKIYTGILNIEDINGKKVELKIDQIYSTEIQVDNYILISLYNGSSIKLKNNSRKEAEDTLAKLRNEISKYRDQKYKVKTRT